MERTREGFDSGHVKLSLFHKLDNLVPGQDELAHVYHDGAVASTKWAYDENPLVSHGPQRRSDLREPFRVAENSCGEDFRCDLFLFHRLGSAYTICRLLP